MKSAATPRKKSPPTPAPRAIERGDTVLMQGVSCRVVLVCNGEALLSYEEAVSAEENAERKSQGRAPLTARTRYEVCDASVMVRT